MECHRSSFMLQNAIIEAQKIEPSRVLSLNPSVSVFGQTHLPVALHWPQPFSRVQISPRQDPNLHSRPRSLRKENDCSGQLIRGQWLPSDTTPRPGYSLRSKQTSSARNLRRFRAPRLRMAAWGATTGRSRGAISSERAEELSLPGRLRAAPQPSRPYRHTDLQSEQFSRYPETHRLGEGQGGLIALTEASLVWDGRRVRGRALAERLLSLGYEAGSDYFEFPNTRCWFSAVIVPVGDTLFSSGQWVVSFR